jgi:hypothetical protein
MTVIRFGKPEPDDIFADPVRDPVKEREFRRKNRTLRTYARMAHEQHFCDYCCRNIEPGDRYTARVEINNGKFFVSKKHDEPPCPVDPFEEEREILREIDEEDKKKKRPQTKAA